MLLSYIKKMMIKVTPEQFMKHVVYLEVNF